MPYIKYQGFEPLELKQPLWRYMDLAKFVAMLMTESLHLTRVDILSEQGDKFEGLFPDAHFKGLFAKTDKKLYHEEENKDRRKFYYVNCWHGNDSESDAMWKIYGKSNQGIAVRSTFQQLRDALEKAPQKIWIGTVKYLDKFTWVNPPSNPAPYACMIKRKSFEHEKEIRLLWYDEDAEQTGQTGQNGKEIPCLLESIHNKHIQINRVSLAHQKSEKV